MSAKHLKYHAAATLREIAPEIAGASVTAKTLTDQWMAGHKAGFPRYPSYKEWRSRLMPIPPRESGRMEVENRSPIG